MKELPSELIYVLLFGALLAFNFVMRKLAEQRRQDGARDGGPGEPDDDEIPEEVWRGGQPPALALPPAQPGAVPRPPSRPPPVRSPAARHRFSRAALLGNRRQVQDAFVVATILGRCRADEPHEPHEAA